MQIVSIMIVSIIIDMRRNVSSVSFPLPAYLFLDFFKSHLGLDGDLLVGIREKTVLIDDFNGDFLLEHS